MNQHLPVDSLLRPFPPFFLTYLLLPRRNTQTTSQMHHHTPLRSTMPMLGPRLTNNDISDLDLPWLPATVTNPSRTHLHLEDLASLMRVPVRARPRRESHVVEKYSGRVGFCTTQEVRKRSWKFWKWRLTWRSRLALCSISRPSILCR